MVKTPQDEHYGGISAYRENGSEGPKKVRAFIFNYRKIQTTYGANEKKSLLRRIVVSFRSAGEESRIEKGNSANTPGPSKTPEPKTKLRAEENVRDTENHEKTDDETNADGERREQKKEKACT